MIEHLLDAGYTILTPDRPGYLGTPLGNSGSPRDQADLLAALLDTLQIESVALVAASAGGPTALRLASVIRIASRRLCSYLPSRSGRI